MTPDRITQPSIIYEVNNNNMFWNKEIPKYNESEEYAKKQQVIDALLVLSKLLEFQADTDKEFRDKAKSKISSLIDKV